MVTGGLDARLGWGAETPHRPVLLVTPVSRHTSHLGPPVQACRAEEGCWQAGAPRVDQGLPKVLLGHAVRQGGQPSRFGLRSKTHGGSEKQNDLPKGPAAQMGWHSAGLLPL